MTISTRVLSCFQLFEWQQKNGEAFVFGRSDWQYVFNTFCFGYKFLKTKAGLPEAERTMLQMQF